jgi:DNA polymerase III subunit delta'
MSFTPDEALALLTRAQADGRLGHAYLITGDAGSGKRQLAADVFRLVNGLPPGDVELLFAHPDAHTVEPESKSRRIIVDQMRELERALHMKAGSAAKKLGVIFEADRLQPQAANAFLKTLEEPPANSMLLLLTTAPEMLLETILSRCLLLQLRPPAEVVRSAWEGKLLTALSEYFAQPVAAQGREIPQIFGLVRDFQDILADCKDSIASENKAELKAEEKLVKGVVEARYLEKLEEQYEAMGAARSQRERTSLIELLTTWWTDVSRQRAGATHLDLPHYAEQTAWLAQQEDALATLERLEALENLKTHLAQNINEPLALESAFLKAFV